MTVVARDLKNNDTTDAGFDLLTDPTTIGAVTGDAGITRILFGSTGVDGGFAQGSAANGMLVDLGSNNDVTVTSGTVAATQSGTWNIGTVTTVTGVTTVTTVTTVSTVSSVAAVIPGTGATNLGKAEDAASASGDTGVAILAVQKATPANTAGTDGDYEFLQISAGRLWASATIDAALPTGTNNIGDVDILSVVPGTGVTNLGKAEDGAHATGDVGVMALAVRTDTPANRSGTDGDYEPIQMAAGRVWASATIDAALPAGTNAIGKLAANSGVDIGDVDITSVVPGTTASSLGKAEDAAHASADVGVMALAVRTDTPTARADTDGDYEPLQTAGGRLHVNGPIAHRTDALFNNNASVTPAFQVINAGSSGNNTVLAAQSSKKLRVVSAYFIASGTVGVQFQTAAGGTAITGRQRLTAQTGASLPFNPVGWFETASGQLLNLNLDAAIGVYGSLTYIAV